MSLFRAAAKSLRAVRLARTYASEAPAATGSGKLILNLLAPHNSLIKNTEVQQVNLSATSGDMGILSSHVPSIEQLKPGLVEVVFDASRTEKWFVSGGFAVINPDSSLNINAVEAFPLENFDKETVQQSLAEAQRVASSNGSEEERATAAIQIEVYEAINAALTK